MAKIKITLEDDNGQPLTAPREYALEVGGGTLGEIEQAVEQFKRQALPELESHLLQASQSRWVKKKVS